MRDETEIDGGKVGSLARRGNEPLGTGPLGRSGPEGENRVEEEPDRSTTVDRRRVLVSGVKGQLDDHALSGRDQWGEQSLREERRRTA